MTTTTTPEIKLSAKQQLAVDLVMGGHNVFITGPGGTGKSKTIEEIVDRLQDSQKIYELTATTGKAAITVGGMTLHSFASIGLGREDLHAILRKIEKNPKHGAWTSWEDLDVLIIDEVSMLLPDYFEKLDAVARTIRRVNKPFGGVQMVFVGDFFQLPPVHKTKPKVEFVFEHKLWNETVEYTIQLDFIFRQSDQSFSQLLNRIRFGVPTRRDIGILQSRVHAKLDCSDGIFPARLYSRKSKVEEFNEKMLAQISVPSHAYTVVTGIGDDIFSPKVRKQRRRRAHGKKKRLSTERKEQLLAKMIKDIPVPEKLFLKVGAQVMLVCNLCVSAGLVNGSQGVIIGFDEETVGEGDDQTILYFPIVKFTTGAFVRINPRIWSMEYFGNTIWASHIPLILAWAYTIHKSQSQTLDRVVANLDRSVFAYGQAYVALSRVRSLEGLTLGAFDPKCIRADPKVTQYYQNLKSH